MSTIIPAQPGFAIAAIMIEGAANALAAPGDQHENFIKIHPIVAWRITGEGAVDPITCCWPNPDDWADCTAIVTPNGVWDVEFGMLELGEWLQICAQQESPRNPRRAT